MLFNSIEYLIFLPFVFLIYWILLKEKTQLQNLLILLASYIFYSWWDWRFLSLIFISSMTDYVLGIKIHHTDDSVIRKRFLYISLAVNLGLLCFFKYFNFFIDSFSDLSTHFGVHANVNTLNIILPVGISFYTFQTLSYTIDIYKKRIEPVYDIVVFFSFVSFFPQLVAGPIERARNLLPQFINKRVFDNESIKDGLRLILWGLFKKIVIADTSAKNVDYIFSNYDTFGASTLFLGTIFFAFQIYGDFSGYSDIAIGSARLFGIKLMRNFALPYFAKDVMEFWKRWHISLSTWFRDYVYIPLGGSYGSNLIRSRNILITFTLSGLWHGANWTYIAWGFLNGLYYLPHIYLNLNSHNFSFRHQFIIKAVHVLQILITFFLIQISWIFFRSVSIYDAFQYINRLFSFSLFSYPAHLIDGKYNLFLIILLLIVEWIQRTKEHGLDIVNRPIVLRWIVYWFLACIILLHNEKTTSFIYFQF